jgi:1,2-phenylacetyl-CoA epoxidase PaaB subunit
MAKKAMEMSGHPHCYNLSISITDLVDMRTESEIGVWKVTHAEITAATQSEFAQVAVSSYRVVLAA